MNDPCESEDLLHEDLQAEYMALMGAGDRAAFDFALEHSDKVNYALQWLGMGTMRAVKDYEKVPEPARAIALALWTASARTVFLDVVEKEAAPLWADHQLPKRLAELEEMREQEKQDLREYAW